MHRSEIMKLTQSEITAIDKCDAEKCIDILHECAERLGLMTVREYVEISGMKRRTVYDHIENGKITAIDFCESKLIILNDK